MGQALHRSHSPQSYTNVVVPHYIFDAIQEGDERTVMSIAYNDVSTLFIQNNNGAKPIHMAYLQSQYDIARQLIAVYPSCATLTYAPGIYEGESILHIAIVKRAFHEVDWLLDQFPELVDFETIGSFFAPGGVAYFGGYPFLFAISTNQLHIVERILDMKTHGSPNTGLTCCDSYGNNALHMAIIHDLPEMMEYILDLQESSRFPPLSPLTDKVNNEGLTPLALAAAMGRVRMFKKLFTHLRRLAWVYGPTRGELIPLRHLEQPVLVGVGEKKEIAPYPLALQCIAAGEHHPMTNCIATKHHGAVSEEVLQGRLALAGLPELHQMLNWKWKRFGRRIFLMRFIPACIVMLMWTIAVIIPDSYTQESYYLNEAALANGFIIMCESIVLAWVVWTFIREILRFARRGWRYLFSHYGVVGVGYWLRIIFCCLVMADVGLRAALQYDAQLIVTAIASIFGWTYLLTLFVGFKITGPYVMMVKQMIFRDLRKFAIVWLMILVGFSTAVHLCRVGNKALLSNSQRYFMNFRDMVIQAVLGEFLFEDVNEYNPNGWLLSLLLVSYIIIMIIIMMSFLIALLANTFHTVARESERRWYIERFIMMSTFEDDLSVKKMYEQRLKYASPLPSETFDFDSDLYYSLTATHANWQREVGIKQETLLEEESRKEILEAESAGWKAIIQQVPAQFTRPRKESVWYY